MAFVWSLIALTNPDLQISIVASSDYRKPLEAIPLPQDLLLSSCPPSSEDLAHSPYNFDVVFQLFGEQRLPGLFAMLQFPALHHIWITSEKFPADCMSEFLPQNSHCTQLKIDPFDPMDTQLKILAAASKLSPGSRIGFNLTGGTKMMFAGANAACRKLGAIPFYLETRNHDIMFLHDFKRLPLRGVDNVEHFFELNGFHISRAGRWEDDPDRERRIELTKFLWRKRGSIRALYSDLACHNERDASGDTPFHFQRGNIEARLDGNRCAFLGMGAEEFIIEDCSHFAKYLSGGWLEEYTYLLLEPLLQAGQIRDLRVGLEITWRDTSARAPQAAQEFDICITDGKTLQIIECKAGWVSGDHVIKLQNIVRHYGGVEARGTMLCATTPGPAALKRLESVRYLTWIAGDYVPIELQRIIVNKH